MRGKREEAAFRNTGSKKNQEKKERLEDRRLVMNGQTEIPRKSSVAHSKSPKGREKLCPYPASRWWVKEKGRAKDSPAGVGQVGGRGSLQEEKKKT